MIDHQRRLLDQIPNNVGLTEDRQVLKSARALASGLSRLVEGYGAGRLPGGARLSAHGVSVDPKGWAKFDYVRCRNIAGACCSRPQEEGRKVNFGAASRRAGVAGSAGRISRHAAPADRDPRRHRARLGRAAAPSRQDRALALRHAQSLPGQCRGRAPSLGDGLSPAEIFRPRRPRGGRRSVAPPLGRCRGCAAHARRLQRGDAGLAVLLHVHLLHRS